MERNTSDDIATAAAENEPEVLDADMTVREIVAALERLQFRNGFRLGGYVMPITKIRGLGTKHRHGVFLAEGE